MPSLFNKEPTVSPTTWVEVASFNWLLESLKLARLSWLPSFLPSFWLCSFQWYLSAALSMDVINWTSEKGFPSPHYLSFIPSSEKLIWGCLFLFCTVCLQFQVLSHGDFGARIAGKVVQPGQYGSPEEPGYLGVKLKEDFGLRTGAMLWGNQSKLWT